VIFAEKITLIHKFQICNTAKTESLGIFHPLAKWLICKGFKFLALQHESIWLPLAQSEKRVFQTLSTKLSTGSVDKSRNSLVYGHLAAL
jgi:hypothetical protein